MSKLDPEVEVSRETFDYLMKNDVPSLLDGICKHLMTTQPPDASQSVIEYLQARKVDAHGGVAIAGRNVGGGWLRIIDGSGRITGSVDKLPFHPFAAPSTIGNGQLMVAAAKEAFLFAAMNICDGESSDAASSPPSSPSNAASEKGEVVSEIHRYGFDGELQLTVPCPKPISCMEVDKVKGHLWVMFRTGSGMVLQYNGTKIRDVTTASLSTAAHAIRLKDGHYWILTSRGIEQRDYETGVLKTAIHLPDSMLRCNTLLLGQKHIYCSAPNPDGSANYVGVFDYNGRPATHFVPQGGSVLCFDHLRGGLWQAPRHGSSLIFTNEKGAKVVSVEWSKGKNVNITIDKGSGLVWYFRMEGDASMMALHDPLRGVHRAEVELPEVGSGVTHMIPL